MLLALREAEKAYKKGEVPAGAVITDGAGKVLGKAGNRVIAGNDSTAHAEIVAIRKAEKKSKNFLLSGASIFVTVEPCIMCWGAIQKARIKRVVFGAGSPKDGAFGGRINLSGAVRLNHTFSEVKGGVFAEESAALLKKFFKHLRNGEVSEWLKEHASKACED